MEISFPGNPFAQPNAIAVLIMLLWLPCVVYIFNVFPARRAIVISFLTAWLFLPEAQILLPALPNYTKISATCYGILISTVFFDAKRLKSFQFGLLDIPMLIWCVCPFFSSLSNGLGVYDGASATLSQFVTWGIPYFLGRIYLNDFLGLRLLAVGIFVGGLIYVPLCLFEIRFSPQLHRILYGGHAGADFSQSIRYGGFRPTVFLSHGLAVGAWMMAATLIGIWLWQTKSLKSVRGIPMYFLVPVLFVTFVLIKSSGAYFLLFLALVILYSGLIFRTAVPVYALAVGIGVYLLINTTTENYFTDQIIQFTSGIFPEDRVASMEFRFNNEELLADRARERFWLGWGGWGRALLYDDSGNQLTVPDSLWIVTFGNQGMVGVASLFSAMLLPPIALFLMKCPGSVWGRKEYAPPVALAVALVMYTTDCLMNAMINPIYIVACGAIAGAVMRVPTPVSLPKTLKMRTALPRVRGGKTLPAPNAMTSQSSP